MLLNELLEAVDVIELRGDPRTEIASVTHDSRRAGPGALFCCVPGSTADGHDHAAGAVAAGAAALLVERLLDLPVPQAKVASTRAAMAPVAAAFFGHPSRRMRVLGVTGTNGKTTTTYLLEAIARAGGFRPGVIGTVETRIDTTRLPGERTTPEATDLQAVLAKMVEAGVGVAAIEVSSHALALHRVDATTFAAACFTNLSHDHLDFHDGLEAYFEAKARLFDPARTGAAAINLDDPQGVSLARRAASSGLAVTGFGLEAPEAVVRAEGLEVGPTGNRFRLVTDRGWASVVSPLLGRFNVMNALGAAATALATGIALPAVAEGLSAPIVVPGRMERVDAGQPFPVIVDYAHTPDGLDQVLRAGRQLVDGGRLVVVFGCGGDRDRAKRPAMGKVAATLADVVYVTSDNPRSEDPAAIAAEVVAGIPAGSGGARLLLDRRLAIHEALGDLRAGDVLVIAGKGHETGQTAGDLTIPFDDRLVAREELAGLGFDLAGRDFGDTPGPGDFGPGGEGPACA